MHEETTAQRPMADILQEEMLSCLSRYHRAAYPEAPSAKRALEREY